MVKILFSYGMIETDFEEKAQGDRWVVKSYRLETLCLSRFFCFDMTSLYNLLQYYP